MSDTPHAEPHHGTKHPSWITEMFERTEHAISVSIGVILVIATLLVLTGTIAHMSSAIREWPETENVFQIVDKLLFVLMLVEILHTVRASITSMQLAVEPFLIVGLIATVRRILVVTLQMSSGTSATSGHPAPTFDHAMIELGVLAGLTLVLITSVYIARRSQAITNEEVEG